MELWGKWMKWSLALALGAALMLHGGLAEARESKAKAKAPPPPAAREIKLQVTDKGFEPSPITLKKGEPVKLLVTRVTEQTCATDIVIDEPKTHAALPLNQEVAVSFTPTKTGELHYGCAMDKMVGGVFVVQ